MNFKSIIFDLDGTLLDTLETLSYYCNKALSIHGFATYPKEAYKHMVGDGAKNLVRRMLEGQNAFHPDAFQKVYNTYIEMYHADTLYKTTYYDGILDLLDGLKQKGISMAVLSNKPHEATAPIIQSFFGDTFSLCYGARDGVPLKPDPEAALSIAHSLGSSPKECLYAGDTAVDILTAKNAGFFSIGVLWGFRDRKELKEAGADFIAEKPADILALL